MRKAVVILLKPHWESRHRTSQDFDVDLLNAAEDVAGRRVTTNRPVHIMKMIKATLSHPKASCINIPVFRKQACITVIAVKSPTAKSFVVRSVGSVPVAKRVYFANTIQLLAVNPSSTAWTATSVDARNRGLR